MENNEQKSKAQHSTGKHPEPSDNVQAEIETVTPDTENGGLEDFNKHESQDKAGTPSKADHADSGKAGDSSDSRQQVSDEPDTQQQSSDGHDTEQQSSEQQDSEQQVADQEGTEQSNSDEIADGDARGDVETVSP